MENLDQWIDILDEDLPETEDVSGFRVTLLLRHLRKKKCFYP